MVNHIPEPENISKHSKTLENITQVDNHSPEILGNALKSWQYLSTVVSLAALLRRRLSHLWYVLP